MRASVSVRTPLRSTIPLMAAHQNDLAAYGDFSERETAHSSNTGNSRVSVRCSSHDIVFAASSACPAPRDAGTALGHHNLNNLVQAIGADLLPDALTIVFDDLRPLVELTGRLLARFSGHDSLQNVAF